MTTYSPSTPVVQDGTTDVKSTTPNGRHVNDLNDREEKLLRVANGIRDEVVFPRLRHIGIAEADLGRIALRLVRYIQWSRSYDGAIAAILGIVPSGINGSAAAQEVG